MVSNRFACLVRMTASIGVLGAAVVSATPAFAGDCPTCITSADCGGDFCVNWATSPGCGALTQICCPGQGCNVENGCPSCFLDGNCTVVDGPETCPQATTSSAGGGGVGGAGTGGSAEGGGNAGGANAGGAAPNGAGGGTPTTGGAPSTGGGASGDGADSEEGCGCTVIATPTRYESLVACGLLIGIWASRRRPAA